MSPNVAGVSLLVINGTAATTVIGLSGGVIGQEVTVVKALAMAGTALTITGAANFMLAGTGTLIANDSASYRFINVNGTVFKSAAGVSSP